MLLPGERQEWCKLQRRQGWKLKSGIKKLKLFFINFNDSGSYF